MTTPDTISEARRQLLEKLRRGELQASSGVPQRLVPRPLGARGPLSPDLEQLWLRDQLSGGAPINNESFTIHKHGLLDPEVLERCFHEIARRHEIWRSAFPQIDGQIVQRVDSHARVTLPFTDLSPLPVEQRETEALRIATEDARRPFDLNAAPLFRVHLVRLAPDYHRIYLTAHRLAFDCQSIEHVLIGELAALYGAYADGLPSPLPELAFQYSDYAAWKQRTSANGGYAAQMEYWRENLAGDLPSIDLPSDRPRPAQPHWRSEMETCLIPAQLMEALTQLSRDEGVTPYMFLLAAFQVLLHRYSGQNEIVVGGKTNTRTRPEFEPLIGSFVNTVVFRSLIGAELSFREFLGRVQTTVLGALAHSDVPFDDIVRERSLQCDAGRHPLFQILFSIRAPFGAFPHGWDLTVMEVHSGASGFDLFVEFAEHPDGLAGRCVYNTDLFNRNTIQNLLRHFQTLLAGALANPELRISQLPLLESNSIRVKLGEIEARLAEQAGVRDAVVLEREDTPGDKRLVAYYTSDQNEVAPGAERLRAHLSAALPEYMVPAAYVRLESLPLTPNGTLDRKALPVPEFVPAAKREFVPPEDDIEERLCNLWHEVLAVHPISVTDNYFDLGGNSLLALRLFSEIKFCFQLELPLATLFYAPTVRTMAEVIRDAGVQAAAPIVPIQPNGVKLAIFCIGALNGEVILFRRLALELGPDQPLYGLQPFSLVDRLSTIETLAAGYIEELRKWGERQPFCLLGYSFGGLVAVEMAQQLRKSGAEPPLVVLIDSPYLEGCKALEPWKDRIRRYRHHVNEIVHGAAGIHHLVDRLRSRYFRMVHKVSTSLGVEVPKIASDIRGRQLLAAESYRAKPYPGRVHLLKAESRPEFFDSDAALGWGGVLSDLRIEVVPGDHGTMNTGMNLKNLTCKLVAALEKSPHSPVPTKAAAASFIPATR